MDGFGFEELDLGLEDVEKDFFCWSERYVWLCVASLESGILYTKSSILAGNISLFVSVFVSPKLVTNFLFQ